MLTALQWWTATLGLGLSVDSMSYSGSKVSMRPYIFYGPLQPLDTKRSLLNIFDVPEVCVCDEECQ